MKIRDVYSSYLLTFGISAFLLGVGNWVVGAVESAKYQTMLQKTIQTGLEESYRNFQQLDHQKNEEVLRRINQDRERYNAARVKLDFYYVVLTGGRWLLGVGIVAIVAAVIRLIRRDSQIKMKKIGAISLKESI